MVPEVMIYDVALDEMRPVTQDDIRQFELMNRAIMAQPPEVRQRLAETFRELWNKEKELPR